MSAKIREYTIIDHLGVVEEKYIKAAYKAAYALAAYKAVYTIKQVALMTSASQEVSKAQKWAIRFSKNPAQVIVIADSESAYNKWTWDIWTEKVNNVSVIIADKYPFEILTMADLRPEVLYQYESEMTKHRRIANVWSRALGWSFSAPLYRDPRASMNELFMARPDAKEYADTPGAHITKISTNPATFCQSKAIVSDEEIKGFIRYYLYLKRNRLLEQSLEAGWQICPHCGKPIRLEKTAYNIKEEYSPLPDRLKGLIAEVPPTSEDVHCDFCTFRIPRRLIDEMKPYYED